MKITLRQALQNTRAVLPEQKKEIMISLINSHIERSIKLRFYGFIGFISLLLMTILGGVYATFLTFQSMAESAFVEYAKLIFTDFDVLVTHWKGFVLLMLESFPVIEVVALLSTLFILFAVIKRISLYALYGFSRHLFFKSN